MLIGEQSKTMTELRNIDLNLLPVFLAVAELGSFTATAERLGMAKSKVSLDISRLEGKLGLALFSRTTRRVALTDAGRQLQQRCTPLLQGVGDALARTRGAQSAVEGTLRISCSVALALQSLAPAVAQFAALHPGLQIELRTSDRVVDLVGEGFDLALRSGWLRDSTLRSVKLGSFDQQVLAAPAYLRRAGTPRTPQDLARHDWVALSLLRTPLTWKFSSPRGGDITVRTQARISADSPLALRALLEHGAGVSVLDHATATEAVATGRLQRLLPQWTLPRGGVFAVFPPGRHLGTNAQAFVSFYKGAAGMA